MADKEKQIIRSKVQLFEDDRWVSEVVNPLSGTGVINAKDRNENFVISSGDFYEIKGIQGADKAAFRSSNQQEGLGLLDEVLSKAISIPMQLLMKKQDRDLIQVFIEPEQLEHQEVQYFRNNGYTYVQIFDQQQDAIVGAVKFKQEDRVKIEVISENGKTNKSPIELYKGQTQIVKEKIQEATKAANQLIGRGVRDFTNRAKSFFRKMKGESEVQLDNNALLAKATKEVNQKLSR